MTTTEAPEFLTVSEFARRLRVSEPTIYRRINDGMLAAIRLGETGAIRVPVTELDCLLETRPLRHNGSAEERRPTGAVVGPSPAENGGAHPFNREEKT